MRPWLRRLGIGLVAVAAIAAAALWLVRDLPRRQIERALSDRLRGEVRIDRLHIRGLHLAEVEGLEVRHTPMLPQLESLRVARIEASGSLQELAKGRYERLQLDGLEAVLAPNSGRPDLSGPALEVDLLEVRAARIRLRGAGVAAEFSLDARIHGLGREATGEVILAGPHLDAAGLLALAGDEGLPKVGVSLEAIRATLLIEQGGRLRLTASAAQATLRRGDRRLALDQPHLEASATLADDRILVTLEPTLPRVGPTRVDLTLGLAPTRLEYIDAHATAIELEPWLALFPPLPADFRIVGQAEVEAVGSPAAGLHTRVAIPSAQIATPLGPLAATGRLACTLTMVGEAVHGPVEASVDVQSGGSGWYATLFPARLGATGEATLGGRSRFAGHVDIATAAAGLIIADGTVAADDQVSLEFAWRWQGCDLPCLAGLAASTGTLALPAGIELEGKVTTQGTLAGFAEAPTLTATTTVERARVRPPSTDAAWSVDLPHTTMALSFKPAERKLAVSLPAAAVSLRLPPLESLDLSLGADGEVELAAGLVHVRRIEVSSPALGQARANASFGRSRPLLAHLHLELPDLGRARIALRPLLARFPDDLALSGSATVDVALARTADGAWSATGPLAFTRAGFASGDGSRVAEGLSGNFDLEAAGKTNGLRVQGTGDAGGCQLLWGTLFGDWSQTRVGVEIRFDANQAEAAAAWGWRATARLSAPGGLRLGASLERSPGGTLGWGADLAADDLAGVIESSLRPQLASSFAALASLTANGAVAARLAGTVGAAAGSARGELRLSGVELTGPRLEVRGLDAELPIDLAWSRPGPTAALNVSGAPRRGTLRFAGGTAGGIRIPPTIASLVVEGDRVTLGSNLVLSLLGGELELGQLSLADLLRPTRQLDTSVQLRALSLAELSRAFGLPPLDGTLDGAFQRVHVTPSTLTVDGTGQLALFGGTFVVGNISGSDVLGRYPRLIFDARFSAVDLGQLTHTFDFGEVTGILAGEVQGCELFRGVPVRFSGELRTVPTAGVPQRISLKAVNNLAIVGTGSGIRLLSAGLRRFISSYPYEAFGVVMRLDEDRFLLRGLERRGDRELFLRGRLPFRLDVVNVEPGATVSFRTMLERLGNLDFSGVRTHP